MYSLERHFLNYLNSIKATPTTNYTNIKHLWQIICFLPPLLLFDRIPLLFKKSTLLHSATCFTKLWWQCHLVALSSSRTVESPDAATREDSRKQEKSTLLNYLTSEVTLINAAHISLARTRYTLGQEARSTRKYSPQLGNHF